MTVSTCMLFHLIHCFLCVDCSLLYSCLNTLKYQFNFQLILFLNHIRYRHEENSWKEYHNISHRSTNSAPHETEHFLTNAWIWTIIFNEQTFNGITIWSMKYHELVSFSLSLSGWTSQTSKFNTQNRFDASIQLCLSPAYSTLMVRNIACLLFYIFWQFFNFL